MHIKKLIYLLNQKQGKLIEMSSRKKLEQEIEMIKKEDSGKFAKSLNEEYFEKKWGLPVIISKELHKITSYVLRDFIHFWWVS
jgi:hypothetical protein